MMQRRRPRSRRARAERFLSTKLGFWVVTSVLAGLATVASAYLNTYFAERDRSAKQVKKLDMEIAFRIHEFMVALDAMTDQRASPWSLKPAYTAEDVRIVTRNLIGPPASHRDLLMWSMYPKEFGDRPLASLLAELGAELGDERLLEPQLKYVSGGKLFAGDDWKGRDFSDVRSLAQAVNGEVLHERWNTSPFYYLNCPPASPLC